MAEPEGAEVAAVLDGLESSRAEGWWTRFLRLYTPLIVQVVRLFERDEDEVGDCYVFVCEQLRRNR